jgi:hypothetical protein
VTKQRSIFGLPPWGRVVAGTAAVLVAALGVSACGGPSASKQLTLSASSGPPGSVVSVSGKAGSGCSPGTNWFGFDFERASGQVTDMTTPVSPKGTWTVSFAVPTYLGSSGAHGTGAPVTPGRYRLVAKSCKGHVVATASFQVTSAEPPALAANYYVGMVSTTDGQGYWLVRADGAVSAFGDARWYGSLPEAKAKASGGVVGIARTYDAHGYWLAAADGAVFGFGDARDYGSLAAKGVTPAGPVVGIAATPKGNGYWLLSAGGHVYGFGGAHVLGMPGSHLAPFDAIGTRPAGGYVVTAADDGAVYLYPGNVLASGGPGNALGASLVGTAVTPSGNGAWQAGMDGGVVTWGDAGFYGSVPSQGESLPAPVIAIAATPDGRGYWLLGAKGHVYSFGDAKVFSASGG